MLPAQQHTGTGHCGALARTGPRQLEAASDRDRLPGGLIGCGRPKRELVSYGLTCILRADGEVLARVPEQEEGVATFDLD